MSTAEIMEASAAPPPEFSGHVNIFTLEQITAWTSDFRNRIGRGGQATVYSGSINWPTSNLNGHTIAVKRSQLTRQVKDEPIDEAKLLSSMQHPNIIQVIGICSTPEFFFLVMPHMFRGSLFSQFKVLGWGNIVKVMTGAALGLQHLHHQELIYRDFKTANILLDEDFNGVLCDFGSVGPATKGMGQHTVGYVDPESFESLSATKENDIYSFGVVLLEVITQSDSILNMYGSGLRISDWVRSSDKRKKRAVAKRLTRGECCKKDDLAITELALRCTEDEINKRPNIQEVVHEMQKLNREERSTSCIKFC